MALKDLLSKWFGSREVVPSSLPEHQLTLREQCLRELASLDLPNPIRYTVSDAELVMISPIYKNIEEYTEMLRRMEIRVRTNKAVKVVGMPAVPITIDLDAFLVSKDGYYLDNFGALVAFHDAARALCESLMVAEGAQFGVQEHNRRVLTNLLNNIIEIIGAFKKVSQMN